MKFRIDHIAYDPKTTGYRVYAKYGLFSKWVTANSWVFVTREEAEAHIKTLANYPHLISSIEYDGKGDRTYGEWCL